MTSREEAAADAIIEASYGQELPEAPVDLANAALAAADAVMLSDATVERAGHVLYDHREDGLICYDHENTVHWCCLCGEHEIEVPWFEHAARAVLTFAVQEEGEE
jgi:hypothetical protein